MVRTTLLKATLGQCNIGRVLFLPTNTQSHSHLHQPSFVPHTLLSALAFKHKIRTLVSTKYDNSTCCVYTTLKASAHTYTHTHSHKHCTQTALEPLTKFIHRTRRVNVHTMDKFKRNPCVIGTRLLFKFRSGMHGLNEETCCVYTTLKASAHTYTQS